MLKLRLTEERVSFQVADDFYLKQATLEGATMRVGDSQFKLLILLPMSTMSRVSAQKIADFIDAGGHVIAMDELPTTSTEQGRNDPALLALWQARFNFNEAGGTGADGRTLVTRGLTPELIRHVRSMTRQDCEVVEGPTEHLFSLRKLKGDREFYWIVNDSQQPRTNLLRLPATGRPERWDAQTGLRAPLFYETEQGTTLIRLKLDPWDAAYAVFSPESPQRIQLISTNADELYVTRASSTSIEVAITTLPQREPTWRCP